MITIICKLRAFVRPDEDTKSYVGYIPSLKVFTQASSEDRIEAALNSAAGCFIGHCYEQGILDTVLHEQGMTKAAALPSLAEAAADGRDFIVVAENFERELELSVPITLIAERQAALACQ